MNNFYENILSNNYIENNLMYILTLLIKEEINNLKNDNNYEQFMDNNSKIGYLLGELRNRSEIKNYFKTSFLSLISELEEKSLVNFSLEENEIMKLIKKEPIEKSEKIEINSFNQIKFNKQEIDLVAGKYLSPLTVGVLKTKIYKSYEKNQDMIGFLDNIIKNSNDELIYSTMNLINLFNSYKTKSSQIMSIFFKKFFLIINFINKFIALLEKNISQFPYSIKCFCKIINILIQKKYPEINTSKRLAFISQFFFKKIIAPFFADPTIELLINNFIISGYTVSNINIMTEILGKLFSGSFFENNYKDKIYTPFNKYILEIMPKILEIFPKLIEVELPSFIEDLIKDKLNPDFTYDYSKLNKDEIIYHYSVCFNYKDLKALLNGLSKVSNKVDIKKYKNGNDLLTTFEQLNKENNRKTLDSLEIKNNNRSVFIIKKINEENNIRSYSISDANNNELGKDLFEVEEERFYLIQEIKINTEYVGLFNIRADSKNNFNIEETKSSPESKETKSKNIIIKLKNLFSDLLYNNFQLKRFNFPKKGAITTQEILNTIINNSKFNTNNIDDSIPNEWYCESILNIIKDIPEEYKENDFKKLYDELEEEINNSINNYHYDFLSEYNNKVKYVEKKHFYYQEILKDLKDLEFNKRAKYIIVNDNIPVNIIFEYEEENTNSFKIEKAETSKPGINELSKDELNKKYYNSINSFINNFPDFSIFQDRQDTDILAFQERLLVPQNLREYFFTIINEHLISENKIKKNDNSIELVNKIYDYVMNKINYKLFPEFSEDDQKVFKNAFLFSWIELKHLTIDGINYILEPFLPKVINKIRSMENEKSPRKKILFLNEIFNLVKKIIFFNERNKEIDSEFLLAFLIYCFIKSQPNNLVSNVKFMKLYFKSFYNNKDNNKGIYENQLAYLNAVTDFIKDIRYEKLLNITEKEFSNNCNNVIKDINKT